MQNCYKQACLVLFLSFKVLICSAQSATIDSIITPGSLKALVQLISADSFQGRLSGSIQAAMAAEFISDQFKKAGVLPVSGVDGYLMPFELKLANFNFTSPYNLKTYNVLAALPGNTKAKELVIFSAHYDHIGTESHSISYRKPETGDPEEGDHVFNGANDNGSGVSALIHLARFYAQYPNRERTLLFIAFSGEEEGLLGSTHLAKSFENANIVAMVNMDMIGRPLSPGNQQPYITGNKRSDLQKLLNKRLFELAPQYGEAYFQQDRFPKDNLFARSDNYPFAQKGIPAHTVIATAPNDKYYHSLADEWETLDYPFFSAVVKAIALGSTGLADGTDTPKKR